jgi:hypothetical protein
MEVGPDVVTGGEFGPEGGLAVTFVLILSCVLVWLASQRKVEVVEEPEPQLPGFLERTVRK